MVISQFRTAASRTASRRISIWLAGLLAAIFLGWGTSGIAPAQNVVPPVGVGDAPAPPAAGGGFGADVPPEALPDMEDAGNEEPAEKKPVKLPADFVPRGEPHPSFNIKDEWKYEPYNGDAKAYKRAEGRWLELRRGAAFDGESDRKVIQEVVKFRLSQFTLKEAREFADPGKKGGVKPVHKIRTDLLNDLYSADAMAALTSGNRLFQKTVLEEIVQTAPLLFEYHFVARLNAVILLAELNKREAVNQKPGAAAIPAVPYFQAYKPLLQILQQEKPGASPKELQPDALRVWAVRGLVRIAEISPATAELPNDIRYVIVDALIAAFEGSGKSHPWYQMRLAEGLGLVDAFRDRQSRATIAQALLKAVMDPKRPMLVRAEAAQALGRTAVDDKLNLSLIALEIAKLGSEVALNATKQPAPPETKMLALRLYMAFQPVNPEERVRLFGLLNKKNLPTAHQTAIRDAYQLLRPIISAILNDRNNELPGLNAKLKAWIDNNPPKSPRISPEMEPIAGQQARRSSNGPAEG